MCSIDVSIFCTAYNHERYIAKCIEGILAQETTYSWELLINDDASTDSTATIIRSYAESYPGKIKAFYQKENLYSQKIGIARTVFWPVAKGRYIARCEGDDFWTDPKKLQKQVDFLETHPDYSATVHAGKYVEESGGDRGDVFRAYDCDSLVSMEDAIKTWLVPTASFVYRADLLRNGNPIRGNAPCGDVPMLLFLLLQGKVHYFNSVMSAYRVNSVSSLSSYYLRQGAQSQIERLDRLIEFYKRFDAFSSFAYSDTVKERCDYLEMSKYLYTGDRAYLSDPGARKQYSRLSIKTKVANWLQRSNSGIARGVLSAYKAIKYRYLRLRKPI